MMADLRELIASVDGVVESPSAFKDDLAYWVNGTEIAHFEADRRLDVRLTRAVIRRQRADLTGDSRVALRSSSSDWVTVDVTGAGAADLVATLIEWAAEAHRPPAGTILNPPPSGADLARRRRFH